MKKPDPKKLHAHMVNDPLRTLPLLGAISKIVKKNDVVVDIGTGLGILAIAAAKNKAKHIWAIDCDSDTLSVARRKAAKEKTYDKMTFVDGLSFDLTLDEKADVIICETVGSFGFDENILLTLLDAKKRLLKKDGKIIPQQIDLWGAPCDIKPEMDKVAEIAFVKKSSLISEPKLLASINFEKRFQHSIHIKNNFICTRDSKIQCFAVWPEIEWGCGKRTSASPLSPRTHWKQGILTVKAKRVYKNDKIGLELIIQPNPDDPYTLTERLWKLL